MSEERLCFRMNGKELIVRDQAQKIINGVLAVKDVVSAAISSDPHAAIAWAGVLVVLPVQIILSFVIVIGIDYTDKKRS